MRKTWNLKNWYHYNHHHYHHHYHHYYHHYHHHYHYHYYYHTNQSIGLLPKPPRQAYKKISNFPTTDTHNDDHDDAHTDDNDDHDKSKGPLKKRLKKRDYCKNEDNRSFANHLHDISDIYLNNINDNNMIRIGLKYNHKANQIRNEEQSLSSILHHDHRRYKKIRSLYDEFVKTNTTTLMNDLMKDISSLG